MNEWMNQRAGFFSVAFHWATVGTYAPDDIMSLNSNFIDLRRGFVHNKKRHLKKDDEDADVEKQTQQLETKTEVIDDNTDFDEDEDEDEDADVDVEKQMQQLETTTGVIHHNVHVDAVVWWLIKINSVR